MIIKHFLQTQVFQASIANSSKNHFIFKNELSIGLHTIEGGGYWIVAGRYVDNCSAWYCDVAAVISAAVMGTAVIRVIMVLLLCPSISSIAYTLRIADTNSSSIAFSRST